MQGDNARKAMFERVGLTREAIFRLFKAAVKDDEKLADEAIAAMYSQMISFDRVQADRVTSLIIRRQPEAVNAFKSLLCDVSVRRSRDLNLQVAKAQSAA
jgi:hypothetical protein